MPSPRFQPGNPGGPGRPKGSKWRSFRDMVPGEDAEAIVRALIEAARAGDPASIKLVIDKLWPNQTEAARQIDEILEYARELLEEKQRADGE